MGHLIKKNIKTMAITKKIQFLRNNTIYTGADGAAARNAAIAGMRGIATGSTTSGDIVDGQAILARYNAAGSASTGDVQTIYGIVHKGVNGKTGVTIYESAELLWAAINQCALSSTTVTAGTGLSGGSQLSASTVTIRHNTGNVTTVPDQATTTITNRTFNAVTAVTDDGLGHMSMIKLARYQLPDDVDTATTQSGYTGTDKRPIVLKNGTGAATTTGGVAFVTAATIDGSGNFSTKTSVSSPSISAGTFSGSSLTVTGTVTAADVTASTSVKSPTISGTNVYGPTISGGSVTASDTVTAKDVTASTSVKSPTISGINISGVTISGGTYQGLPSATSAKTGIVKVVETTGTTSGNTVMSQKAVTEAITAALVDVADALVYKGTVSGQSTSPGALLPAAEKGDVYKVAVSGYVAGQKVEVGDMFICNEDTDGGTSVSHWDVIQNNIDISDISTTTPLSGGGNVTAGPVTIGHETITTSAVMPQGDPTQISDGGEFTAVTSIDTDGYGHPKFVRSTAFKLPTDSKVTQEQFTGTTSNPIIIKVDNSTSASARDKVYYSSSATIDKTGNIKTTGNVSAATVSANDVTAATAVRAGNMSAATISAATSVKSPTINGTNITASNLVTASGFSATAAVSTASSDINASILLSNGKNTNTIDCGTY